MHFLRLSSLFLLWFVMNQTTVFAVDHDSCFLQSRIPFNGVKYRAAVDVVGKHLSGILIIKQQPNQSHRVVFLNEMGVTFFDFTFHEDNWVVNQIMESLDKKSVKKTLAKDFGMLLGKSILKKETISTSGKEISVKLKEKGRVTYYCREACGVSDRIVNFGKKNAVITIHNYFQTNDTPDSIYIEHHKINFTIQLNRIHDVAE